MEDLETSTSDNEENHRLTLYDKCIQSKWYLDKAKTLKSPEQIEKLGRLLNFLDQDEYHDRIDYLSDPVQLNKNELPVDTPECFYNLTMIPEFCTMTSRQFFSMIQSADDRKFKSVIAKLGVYFDHPQETFWDLIPLFTLGDETHVLASTLFRYATKLFSPSISGVIRIKTLLRLLNMGRPHFGRNNKLALSRYSWTKSREDCYYGVDAAFKPFIIKKHIVPERDYPLSKATIEPLLVEEEDYASFDSERAIVLLYHFPQIILPCIGKKHFKKWDQYYWEVESMSTNTLSCICKNNMGIFMHIQEHFIYKSPSGFLCWGCFPHKHLLLVACANFFRDMVKNPKIRKAAEKRTLPKIEDLYETLRKKPKTRCPAKEERDVIITRGKAQNVSNSIEVVVIDDDDDIGNIQEDKTNTKRQSAEDEEECDLNVWAFSCNSTIEHKEAEELISHLELESSQNSIHNDNRKKNEDYDMEISEIETITQRQLEGYGTFNSPEMKNERIVNSDTNIDIESQIDMKHPQQNLPVFETSSEETIKYGQIKSPTPGSENIGKVIDEGDLHKSPLSLNEVLSCDECWSIPTQRTISCDDDGYSESTRNNNKAPQVFSPDKQDAKKNCQVISENFGKSEEQSEGDETSNKGSKDENGNMLDDVDQENTSDNEISFPDDEANGRNVITSTDNLACDDLLLATNTDSIHLTKVIETVPVPEPIFVLSVNDKKETTGKVEPEQINYPESIQKDSSDEVVGESRMCSPIKPNDDAHPQKDGSSQKDDNQSEIPPDEKLIDMAGECIEKTKILMKEFIENCDADFELQKAEVYGLLKHSDSRNQLADKRGMMKNKLQHVLKTRLADFELTNATQWTTLINWCSWNPTVGELLFELTEENENMCDTADRQVYRTMEIFSAFIDQEHNKIEERLASLPKSENLEPVELTAKLNEITDEQFQKSTGQQHQVQETTKEHAQTGKDEEISHNLSDNVRYLPLEWDSTQYVQELNQSQIPGRSPQSFSVPNPAHNSLVPPISTQQLNENQRIDKNSNQESFAPLPTSVPSGLPMLSPRVLFTKDHNEIFPQNIMMPPVHNQVPLHTQVNNSSQQVMANALSVPAIHQQHEQQEMHHEELVHQQPLKRQMEHEKMQQQNVSIDEKFMMYHQNLQQRLQYEHEQQMQIQKQKVQEQHHQQIRHHQMLKQEQRQNHNPMHQIEHFQQHQLVNKVRPHYQQQGEMKRQDGMHQMQNQLHHHQNFQFNSGQQATQVHEQQQNQNHHVRQAVQEEVFQSFPRHDVQRHIHGQTNYQQNQRQHSQQQVYKFHMQPQLPIQPVPNQVQQPNFNNPNRDFQYPNHNHQHVQYQLHQQHMTVRNNNHEHSQYQQPLQQNRLQQFGHPPYQYQLQNQHHQRHPQFPQIQNHTQQPNFSQQLTGVQYSTQNIHPGTHDHLPNDMTHHNPNVRF
eukprot:NP_509861.2 Uncharacterized protein CELE_C05C9.3 [Caenorhabditis elegans]